MTASAGSETRAARSCSKEHTEAAKLSVWLAPSSEGAPGFERAEPSSWLDKSERGTGAPLLAKGASMRLSKRVQYAIGLPGLTATAVLAGVVAVAVGQGGPDTCGGGAPGSNHEPCHLHQRE